MSGRTLRLLAVAEAATLLGLVFIAVPLKHLAGIGEISRVLGPVHGLTFLAFAWAVIRTWSEGSISGRDAGRLFIGAFMPFGGIVNERWLKAKLSEGRA